MERISRGGESELSCGLGVLGGRLELYGGVFPGKRQRERSTTGYVLEQVEPGSARASAATLERETGTHTSSALVAEISVRAASAQSTIAGQQTLTSAPGETDGGGISSPWERSCRWDGQQRRAEECSPLAEGRTQSELPFLDHLFAGLALATARFGGLDDVGGHLGISRSRERRAHLERTRSAGGQDEFELGVDLACDSSDGLTSQLSKPRWPRSVHAGRCPPAGETIGAAPLFRHVEARAFSGSWRDRRCTSESQRAGSVTARGRDSAPSRPFPLHLRPALGLRAHPASCSYPDCIPQQHTLTPCSSLLRCWRKQRENNLLSRLSPSRTLSVSS